MLDILVVYESKGGVLSDEHLMIVRYLSNIQRGVQTPLLLFLQNGVGGGEPKPEIHQRSAVYPFIISWLAMLDATWQAFMI